MADEGVRGTIEALLGRAPLAVLCTQGEAGPYGSLMACAASDDLAEIALATRRATRKHEQLVADPRVALLFDDRASQRDAGNPLQRVTVVTATGRATELGGGPTREGWAARLAARHPALAGFLREPDVALFVVAVRAYEVVSQFEQTERWSPRR